MKKFSDGFTLVEVTIAMALLVMAFGGLMGLLTLTQEAKVNVKNNATAFYLAQEGVDLVRMIRDENYVETPAINPSPADVFDQIFDISGVPYSFTVDYRGQSSLTTVAAGTTVKTTTPLSLTKYNSTSPSTVFYSYAADPLAQPTIFRRLITTTYFPAATPPYLQVTSEVFWQFDNKRNTVTVQDELTAWR